MQTNDTHMGIKYKNKSLFVMENLMLSTFFRDVTGREKSMCRSLVVITGTDPRVAQPGCSGCLISMAVLYTVIKIQVMM